MQNHLSRRTFLGVSASFLAADRLFGQPAANSRKPNPELERLGGVAVAEAKKAGPHTPTSASTATASSSPDIASRPNAAATRPTKCRS
jgi:hypothetical protein